MQRKETIMKYYHAHVMIDNKQAEKEHIINHYKQILENELNYAPKELSSIHLNCLLETNIQPFITTYYSKHIITSKKIERQNGFAILTNFLYDGSSVPTTYQTFPISPKIIEEMNYSVIETCIKYGLFLDELKAFTSQYYSYQKETIRDKLLQCGYDIDKWLPIALSRNPVSPMLYSIIKYLSNVDETIWKQYRKQIKDAIITRNYNPKLIDALQPVAHRSLIRPLLKNNKNVSIRVHIARHGYYLDDYVNDKHPEVRYQVANYAKYKDALLFDDEIYVNEICVTKKNKHKWFPYLSKMNCPIRMICLLSTEKERIKLLETIRSDKTINHETYVHIVNNIIITMNKTTIRKYFDVENECNEIRIALAKRGIYKKDIINETFNIRRLSACNKDNLDILMYDKDSKIRELVATYHKHPIPLLNDTSILVTRQLIMRGYAISYFKKRKNKKIKAILDEVSNQNNHYCTWIPFYYYTSRHITKVKKSKRHAPVVYEMKGEFSCDTTTFMNPLWIRHQ